MKTQKWLALIALASLAACSGKAPEPEPRVAEGPKPVATIHELMEHVVDPTSEAVWNATATVTDEQGVHDKSPKTDEDWDKLRGTALTLAESAVLTAMPGRKVVAEGHIIQDGGTLDVAAIQERLDTQHDMFATHASALQVAAMLAVKAAETKDKPMLDKAAGEIDEACEACHKQFWYPPEGAPKP